MTVRLKDIANDLGLSVVTISKVLRDHPDIGAETRERVLKRMKELNYQPNMAARALITGRSYSFGLVVPDLLHPFFAQIAQIISAEVRRKGYSLLISSSDEDPDLERLAIDQFLARRVDLLLVASAQRSMENFRTLQEKGTPFILLDRGFAGFEANFIGVDDCEVGRIATRHLIEQGCRRIVHLRGPEISTAAGRLEGYRQALREAGQDTAEEWVVSCMETAEQGSEKGSYEVTKKLLASGSRPDGIFCFNDPAALGAMRAILDAGLRIPEDIAVAGCGNLSYSDFLRVPLTSVEQGSAEIGHLAARMALRLAENRNEAVFEQETVQPKLVVRRSSQRLGEVL
jgi:LacI family transcriptional regulator